MFLIHWSFFFASISLLNEVRGEKFLQKAGSSFLQHFRDSSALASSKARVGSGNADQSQAVEASSFAEVIRPYARPPLNPFRLNFDYEFELLEECTPKSV